MYVGKDWNSINTLIKKTFKKNNDSGMTLY